MSMTSCGAHKERNVQQLDFSNLDTTIAPGADYYDYATGGWQKNNPLKPEFARFGSFDLLRENNKEQLKELIETVTTTNNPQGSVAQKISNIYLAGLDSSKLNNDGLTPLAGILSEIDAINDKKSLSKFIGEANKFGEFPFLHFYVEADPMNSSMNLLQTYQNGMTLGEKDYYLSDEESMKNIRQEYLNYITKIFLMLGNSDDVAKAKALNILEMETELARASYSNVELRDPVKNYNKMNIEEFKSKYSGLDWNEVLTVNGLSSAKEISVGQIPYMEIMDVYISTAPLQTIKDYLTFQTVNGATGFLNDDLYNESFNFFGKVMSGKEEQEPRWKRALGTTNGILGEAVGQLYVEKFFPAEAKERMLTLVSNLQSSLGDRITNLDWMSDETKQKALEKLNTFTIKIGYPNKWRDYTNLEINKGDSYYDMVRKSNIFEWEYAISQNEKPVDKDKWYMSPQTVNAYYNPSSNEICFPAAILQPPFFYMNGDDAINYGAIGVVIGHEMTHGFDDQGRQFDKDGNIKDWWTEADAEKFDAKAKILDRKSVV